MTSEQMSAIRSLEGHQVSIALTDGSRIDAAALMAAGRPGQATVWVYCNGNDVFIPATQVRDVWENSPSRRLDRPNG
ncbi:MAG: hypothetical protein M3179_12660 [Actinomycetota bacterium]|nr:hypothetical protein [Actinomycetota bacterium]